MDYKEKAKEIIDSAEGIFGDLKSIKGLDGALTVIPDVVKKVEILGKAEEIRGADKKKLAVAIINAIIDIPFIPEGIEGMIIGFGIDAIVKSLNKLFGKTWLEKIS